MEFLLTFLISLLVVVGLVLALTYGRAPVWRADRRAVLELMQRLQQGRARREEWELFLGIAALHDPELEAIRCRCVAVIEGDREHPPAREGLEPYLYDRAARARLALIMADLERLIASEPYYRQF
ncbi:MAG: hypothetical protein SVU24_06910 [Pseudomonadota bacterium]|jgi:hypothetical protein|nr:hypothetical protein [Pseudomonadota bacterium]